MYSATMYRYLFRRFCSCRHFLHLELFSVEGFGKLHRIPIVSFAYDKIKGQNQQNHDAIDQTNCISKLIKSSIDFYKFKLNIVPSNKVKIKINTLVFMTLSWLQAHNKLS